MREKRRRNVPATADVIEGGRRASSSSTFVVVVVRVVGPFKIRLMQSSQPTALFDSVDARASRSERSEQSSPDATEGTWKRESCAFPP